MLVPSVDRGDHRRLAVAGEVRRGIDRQRRNTDDRHAGGDAKSTGGGKTDAHASETSRPGGYRNAAEIAKNHVGPLHDRAISGISASAWPRTIGRVSLATI